APQILGPMILSAIVHLTGLTDAPPPTLIVNAAQLVMGSVVGCRFLGVAFGEVVRDIWGSTIAALAMLVAAVATSLAVTQIAALPLDQVFLSLSPGGLVEMSLLALALGADIAFVASIHIIRIVAVIAMAPLVFRFVGR
ncbi:MAG: AbrB family transcriptional regulator, partial [Pseudomonadota bacterium]